MNYEKLKALVSERKAQIATVVACAVMFIVGFGTGKATKPEKATEYSNYTPNALTKPGEPQGIEETLPTAPTTSTPNLPRADEKQITGKPFDPNQPCIIKGNISGSNKIYHIKGGSSYEKTVPEQCFDTEAQAEAAGFRKAKR